MAVSKIAPAELVWDDKGLPRSAHFNDLYFSAENGLEETRYVFLEANRLEQRWSQLKAKGSFVICETGFGSGLNLLAAAELWQKVAHKEAKLHFISTELFPMTKADLTRTHQHWPELNNLSHQLVNHYPHLTPGFHRFEIGKNITVTLIFDEITSALKSLCPTLATELWNYKSWGVDAWFLDGFAPSENPAMWNEELFPLIHRLSANSATAATFTCAGPVKRGLSNWGFDIKKIPGYGRKREMLTAKRNPELAVDLESQREPHRKASPCWHLDALPAKRPMHVAIIGAGIAGCTTAEALSRRQIRTTLIDTKGIASGASGNPQAGLYARLSPEAGDLEDFCLHALGFSGSYYKKLLSNSCLQPTKTLGEITGLIQLEKSESDLSRMQKIAERFAHANDFVAYKSQTEISELAGLQLNSGGLFFPEGGWVNGKLICERLANTSGAELLLQTKVTRIESNAEIHSLYSGDNLIGAYDAVVIATAMKTPAFAQASWLPIRPIRGQISFLQNHPETSHLKTVLCRDTSLTPAINGLQSVGATYDLDKDSDELTEKDHIQNLVKLQKLLGDDFPLDMDIKDLQGRAGTRTTTPDYLPILGTIPDLENFNEQYALWQKDRKRAIPEPHKSRSGMYLSLGYGSRGYVYAPLCAEVLASQIAGEPALISNRMIQSLHPGRFLVRALSKGSPLVVT